MSIIEKVRDTILICFIVIVIIPIIFISSVILIDSYKNPDEVPSFFGWKPFIILSNSMTPTIDTYDLIVVKEVSADSIQVGDIIAFRIEDTIITHRVTTITHQNKKITFLTQGDANSTADDFIVEENNLEGIYKTRLKGFGGICLKLQTPIGMSICLSIPVIILFIIQYFDSRDDENEKMDNNLDEKGGD